MRSPIERMIDEACGIGGDQPTKPPVQYVTLFCPGCESAKTVKRDDSDLPGTMTIHARCPDCNPGDFDEVIYFDADGTQLLDDPEQERNMDGNVKRG